MRAFASGNPIPGDMGKKKGGGMKRVAAGSVIVLIGWLFLLGTADAGWVVHSQKASSGGKTRKETNDFERNRIRMEVEDSAHVMNFATRKIIWIEKKEGKYSVMTFEEFKKMIREGIKASRQMREEMQRQGVSIPGISSRRQGKLAVSRLTGATIAGSNPVPPTNKNGGIR